jgi:hypothetical protein
MRRRSLPFWLAAVVPATIAGHALAYALTGRSVSDGHHPWLAPALECSLALLTAVSLALLRRVLTEAGVFVRDLPSASVWALWPRMAAVQTLLFAAIEHAEGTPLGWPGFAMQIVLALLAACVVCHFTRLLQTCAESVARALAYAKRALCAAFLPRARFEAAPALLASLGTHRFQRPPPLAATP